MPVYLSLAYFLLFFFYCLNRGQLFKAPRSPVILLMKTGIQPTGRTSVGFADSDSENADADREPVREHVRRDQGGRGRAVERRAGDDDRLRPRHEELRLT